MHKELLTPGRLYYRLSNALRTRQQNRCDGCGMPMVFLAETPKSGEPNWIIEPASPSCDPCQELIEEIVREHASRYDLWDPTAIYARKPFAAFVPPPLSPRLQ